MDVPTFRVPGVSTYLIRSGTVGVGSGCGVYEKVLPFLFRENLQTSRVYYSRQ